LIYDSNNDVDKIKLKLVGNDITKLVSNDITKLVGNDITKLVSNDITKLVAPIHHITKLKYLMTSIIHSVLYTT